MNVSKACRTILLPDSPAQTDAFGSHERLASAIAELISSDTGGKSIALTGSWGSGKSTVITLLKSKLEAYARVFVFDAWAHEGDPLRRAFLERLIDFTESWAPNRGRA